MESIAAERLNKIGKNPSIVTQREDLENDLKAVSQLLTFSSQAQSDENVCDHGLLTIRKALPLPRPKSFNSFNVSGNESELDPIRVDPTRSGSIQRSETCYMSEVNVNMSANTNTNTSYNTNTSKQHDLYHHK